ncbi:spore germination protein [Halobacillus locisalis]|uniref:Spore germination protein n=1 Tax=Halobacillus locisalis TaxID=220753 RepID=A0A838CPX8_9BACI|nr:spore germination protein [Halobacillus locisalis]MBA2173696.1 spore germination protein [Halobacillus locisalis]
MKNTNSPIVDDLVRMIEGNDKVTVKTLMVQHSPIYVIYIASICNVNKIQEFIVKPLLDLNLEKSKETPVIQQLPLDHVVKVGQSDQMMRNILNGFTLLIENGNFYVVNTTKFSIRQVQEPVTEVTLRGARDGFIESMEQNISMLRMHLRTNDLTFQEFTIGQKAFTNVSVAYLKNEANPELVQEVIKRVENIQSDYISDGGVVEQLIENNPHSLFPEVHETERPTKVSNSLVEGRVAIFVDGSPSVIIAPATLNALFHSTDDYNFKWIPASMIRILRYFAAFISVILPAVYISLISFHHGLIPTDLAMSISKTREGVPIPSFMEALLMELTIEVLREAGVRLPKPIGPAVSIVGAIVLGEAAVTAGIVSPLMVIVVAFSAICSFTVADYALSLALRTLRFFLLLSAAVLGIYGLILAVFLLSIHLTRFRSFNIPYLEPYAPYYHKRWKDSLIRFKFKKRGGQSE